MAKHKITTAPMPVAAIPEALRRLGDDDDDDTLDAIAALGPAAVPALVAMLEAALAGTSDWTEATERALALLGKLADESALPVLMDVLRVASDDYEMLEMVATACETIGAAAWPPALDVLDELIAAKDGVRAEGVAEVLVSLDCKDERLFAHLLTLLEHGDPAVVAGLLTDFGDARAVVPLGHVLSDIEFDPHDRSADTNPAIFEVCDALEALGATLTPTQAEKMVTVRHARKKFAAAERMRETGRNDPCWCGSAKKYKKCCLTADEALQ